MIVHFARMHTAALADELEQTFSLLHPGGRPTASRRIFVLLAGLGHGVEPRMHQRMNRARHEAVVDEEVFLDAEFRVAALEIAGAVILDAMAQNQILSAGRRANRIGLDKSELVKRTLQRRRREEALRDGEAAEVVECERLERA